MSTGKAVARVAFRTAGTLVLIMLLAGGTYQTRSTADSVRRFTAPLEYDFADWTVKAAAAKVGQYGLGAAQYMTPEARQDVVLEFLSSLQEEQQLEGELQFLFGDPDIEDRETRIQRTQRSLEIAEADRRRVQSLAEQVLQEQMTVLLDGAGLDVGGKAFPPVAFRFSELPFALIVSPRHVIRQEANISLETELSLERRVTLERRVENRLDVSALVVPIGGYGTYPTMVQMSDSLVWVTEVVAHEWIHNYLNLRPLGMLYGQSPELRTMNETAATLLGREFGRRLLERYYPSLAPPEPQPQAQPEEAPTPQAEPPGFDFRAEMRETREQVDSLLAAGKIEEAEAYMEARRLVFWEHGYRIRRLNQAYFAFHGSYAADPGGAAGDDPIGEAVRELWDRVDDPVQFLRTMQWMTGPDDLARALGRPIDRP